ncbi:MAG: thioesterase family protein [Acidimicrobiales bacterium]|jgi:acyl-CoA thioesterase
MTTESPAHSDAVFRTATAVEPLDLLSPTEQAAGATSRWSAAIAEGWDIAGNANGGYLLAITARAMSAAIGRPDPITVTAHYLKPGKPGPVSVAVNITKQGRTFGTATATLAAEDRPLLEVLGTFGELTDSPGPRLVDLEPPPMPSTDRCIPVDPTDTFPPPFMGRVELRLHPDDATFLRGNPSGHALMRGWFRLRNGEFTDTIALLCASDAFPPTIFNANLPVAWTPTIELTTHVRYRPEPGWLRCRFATHFVTGGFLEEDGEIWDATGRLVAQSRQLALVPSS